MILYIIIGTLSNDEEYQDMIQDFDTDGTQLYNYDDNIDIN